MIHENRDPKGFSATRPRGRDTCRSTYLIDILSSHKPQKHSIAT